MASLSCQKNCVSDYHFARLVAAMDAERIRKVIAEKTSDENSDVWEAPGQNELMSFVKELTEREISDSMQASSLAKALESMGKTVEAVFDITELTILLEQVKHCLLYTSDAADE